MAADREQRRDGPYRDAEGQVRRLPDHQPVDEAALAFAGRASLAAAGGVQLQAMVPVPLGLQLLGLALSGLSGGTVPEGIQPQIGLIS